MSLLLSFSIEVHLNFWLLSRISCIPNNSFCKNYIHNSSKRTIFRTQVWKICQYEYHGGYQWTVLVGYFGEAGGDLEPSAGGRGVQGGDLSGYHTQAHLQRSVHHRLLWNDVPLLSSIPQGATLRDVHRLRTTGGSLHLFFCRSQANTISCTCITKTSLKLYFLQWNLHTVQIK